MRPLITSEIIGDSPNGFDRLSEREWLSVNGSGGFASGTISGANTRRYHALLVAALAPPLGRMTLLSKVEETISVQGGDRYDLAANRYPSEVVYPEGWQFITEFANWPVPTWTYCLPGTKGDTVIVKRVYLARNTNTVYVTYTLREAPAPVTLTVSPYVCWKEYHSEMRPWSGFPVRRGQEVGGWYVQATGDSPTLRMMAQGATWSPAGWWHEHITHDREKERGQDFEEALFCPAEATVRLRAGQTLAFVATAEPGGAEPTDATLVLGEIAKRHETLVQKAGVQPGDDAGRDLVIAADNFLVQADGLRSTILAGYPWFTDWGRDTMISLPGLCLATGRHDLAREILLTFASFVSEGMIPNRFPDRTSTPDYNTVDATLWFIHACGEYIDQTGDKDFQATLTPVLVSIIAAHVAGTRYGIKVDEEDGLLASGEPGVQLTWMDAKVGDWVVTPRQGKAVEINALWINALRVLAAWQGKKGGKANTDRANRAQASFQAKFVRPDGRGLYDVLMSDGTPDASVRPNQVIAAALPTELLTDAQLKSVLEVATDDLLTPYGLRTLAAFDRDYRGHYNGDQGRRDGAYHQGTIWPWLMGSYITLYRRVHGADLTDTDALLEPLLAHLRDYGVGGVAEIFDGDAPHAPNGCPWQAWSVAEILRVRQVKS